MDVRKNWTAIQNRVIGTEKYWYLTPTHLSFYQALRPVIKKYAQGKLIDLGAGKLIMRPLVLPYVKKYQSLDLKKTHSDLDFIADIEDLPLKNAIYDSVLCIQVLEHTPHFWTALDEIKRILKPGGILILSVPHLSYLHGAPFDFYRFTKFSIKKLLQERQMKIIKIIPAGGIFSFIFTGPMIYLISLAYPSRILLGLVLSLCKYFSKLIVYLDGKIDRDKIYALNYIAIARKI